MDDSRREFLKRSGCCALGMVSLATQMGYFGSINALAQKAIDDKVSPDGGADYKALVCMFWAGGNDGNNLVIPNHNDSSISNYAAYSGVRSASGLAILDTSLIPITVPRLNNLTYGFHPQLGPLVTGGINNGIAELYGQGK